MPDDWSDRRDALLRGCVLRDYSIEEVLGHGGFGIVYRARHNELDHVVAIKEYLPSELAVREGATIRARGADCETHFADGLRRFRDEAKALIEFQQHPSIVDCREFFRANGTAYLVMEYVEGLPLSELLRQREAAGKPFTESDLLAIAVPLAQGLAHIHRAGVIHRDIKPANILVRSSDQQPVLVDFGAAKQSVAEHSRSLAPYTEGYAALEQVADGQLGPWTDLYGYGAVLWRMVAGGNPPWDPPNPVKVESRANARVREADDPLPTATELGAGRFSSRLLEVIDGCLQLRDTERIRESDRVVEVLQGGGGERPQSATAEPQAEGSSVVGQPQPGRAEVQPSRSSPGRWWKIVGVATAAMIAVALAAVALIPRDENAEATEMWSFSVEAEPETAIVALLNWPEAYRPGMLLPPGQYEIVVSAPGFVAHSEWVTHSESETLHRVHLERLPDVVPELTRTPSGATTEAADSTAVEQEPVSSSVADAKQSLVGAQQEQVQTPSDADENLKVSNVTTVEDEQASRDGSSTSKTVVPDLALASANKKTDTGEVSPTNCEPTVGGWENCFEIAESYRKGDGVPRDAARAAEFYGHACAGGHTKACSHLGFLYDAGEGVEPDDVRAAGLYRRGCVGGETVACNNLGVLYSEGEGVGVDKARAAELYGLACDGGYGLGCWNLGTMYEDGEGVHSDQVRAAELYARACNGGSTNGCLGLGILHRDGEGVPQDQKWAAELFELVCDSGDAVGCRLLGYMYENGEGVPRDKARAAELFGRACEGGDAPLCSTLGFMYEYGVDVPIDPERAARFYQRACEGGHASGCQGLGSMYEEGEGVPSDLSRAAELYDQACDSGEANGCGRLGILHRDGKGMPQDQMRAAELFRLGCEGGDAFGCNNLGLLYYDGHGVGQDRVRAAELYERACDGYNMSGCHSLGLSYFRGHGVVQDKSIAASLFTKACENGIQRACEALETLEWR